MAVAALLLALLIAPASADQDAVVVQGERVVAVEPARAPRSDAMLGAACSYRTGVTARRVLAEGADYAYVGRLSAGRSAAGDVACPYGVGGQDDTCVVASELVEHLVAEGGDKGELALEGRVLEIDGVRYVVLTAYTPSKS